MQQYHSHECSADWVHRLYSVRVDSRAFLQTRNRRSSLSFADPRLLWLVGFNRDRHLRFGHRSAPHRRLQVTFNLDYRCIRPHWMDCAYCWNFLHAFKGSQQIQSWTSFRTLWDGHSRECELAYAGGLGKDISAAQLLEIDEIRNKITKNSTRLRNQTKKIDYHG